MKYQNICVTFIFIVPILFIGTIIYMLSNPLPLVSVIIPVYNRETLLSDAVHSLLTQTYKHLEIIIVDDGSTDNTLKVAQSLAKKDSRIRVIASPHQGRWGARNTGLEAANGKYIAYQDSDDISLPYRIERLVTYMEKNSYVHMVGSAFAPIGKIFPPFDYVTTAEGLKGEDLRLIFLLGATPTLQGTILMRRDFIEDNHIRYREEQGRMEELSLYEQFYEHNGYIANLPEVLYQYRMHGDNPKLFYKEAKEFVMLFFNAYWERYFPKTKRAGDFCERLNFISEKNKTWPLFQQQTIVRLQHKLCPDGENLFHRSSVVLRINDMPEIVVVRAHNSNFYSYIKEQKGLLLFQRGLLAGVEWQADKICAVYPTYWSEKWKTADWND